MPRCALCKSKATIHCPFTDTHFCSYKCEYKTLLHWRHMDTYPDRVHNFDAQIDRHLEFLESRIVEGAKYGYT